MYCKEISSFTIYLTVTLCGSCWYFPVEAKENYCWCSWGGHFSLGAFWSAWISFAHSSLPYSNSFFHDPFPLVECVHLHQQVSHSIFLIPCLFDLILFVPFDLFFHMTRAPPRIPEVEIPENIVIGVASAFRIEVNRALALIHETASGKDLKKFLAVCFFSLSCSRILENLIFFCAHIWYFKPCPCHIEVLNPKITIDNFTLGPIWFPVKWFHLVEK